MKGLLFEIYRNYATEDETRVTQLAEQMDCQRIVHLCCESLAKEKESRTTAEKRVTELTEGLKETMALFTEREESFDSLARINKEQERKVWGKEVVDEMRVQRDSC